MTALHILFVTQHYPPEVATTGRLLAELAKELSAAILYPIENADTRVEMGGRTRIALGRRFNRRIAKTRTGEVLRNVIGESSHA